jgi:hypothetical protein
MGRSVCPLGVTDCEGPCVRVREACVCAPLGASLITNRGAIPSADLEEEMIR